MVDAEESEIELKLQRRETMAECLLAEPSLKTGLVKKDNLGMQRGRCQQGIIGKLY